MTSTPHCFASASSASTRSPAATLTGFGLSALAWAAAVTIHANATIAERTVIDLSMLHPPETRLYGRVVPRRLALAVPVTQMVRWAAVTSIACGRSENDTLPFFAGANGKRLLQQVHEGIQIGRAENAAHLNGGDRGIFDDDLARVVAIEFGDCVGERRIAKREDARAPGETLLDLRRAGLLHEHGIMLRTRDRSGRKEQRRRALLAGRSAASSPVRLDAHSS